MISRQCYIKSVKALPDYKLEVEMGTNTQIVFDFNTRLLTAKFSGLKELDIFNNVYTDGGYLIFKKSDLIVVKITAKEFMDLVLVDRTTP